MTKRTKNSGKLKGGKPTVHEADKSKDDYPIDTEGVFEDNFEGEETEFDVSELVHSTSPEDYCSTLEDEVKQEVDTEALASVSGGVLGDKPKVKVKLSRKERRAQNKELKKEAKAARQKIEAQRKKNGSIKRQLKDRDKKLTSRSVQQRIARKTAKDVTAFIGYNAMYEDGVCEIEEGLFSSSQAFGDTSYHSVRDDMQKGIFASMSRLYDMFGADTLVQLNVINTPILAEEIGARRFFNPGKQKNANAKHDSQVFNGILNDKMREGVSNIRRERYLTYTVAADTAEEAVPKLVRIENETARILNSMGSSTKLMKGADRLRVLHSLLRPGVPFIFDYERDISTSQGMTTKDAIAPLSLDFKPNDRNDCFTADGVWGQVLVMRKFGSELSDRALSDIANLPIALNATWYAQPIDKADAINFVRQRSAWIDKEVIDEQRSAVKKGYDFNLLPLELKYSKEETEDVMDHLQNKNQRLYDFTGLVYTYADTEEQLNNQVLQIISTARQNSIEIDLLNYRQREAVNSMLPLGHNHVNISRKFTTAQTSILMPFATQELDDQGGNFYGQNRHSGNLVIGNRKRLASPVGFICGKTGSGKGMFAKNEMTGTIFANPNDEIYVFDRAGEYPGIIDRYGGVTYEFAVGSHTYLNPFDTVDVSDKSRDEQIAFKVDAVIAQASASAMEAGQHLSEVDQSIITSCVEKAFYRAEERGDGKPPLLQDFYDILLEQPEPEAATIALRYRRYVEGAMSFFNHQSNVDFGGNRLIDINFKELPDSMLVFALITACEAIRNRMYANHKAKKRTWLYIEEIQSLFKYPTVLNYFARFANEGRKFGLLLTGITQNSVAMLENEAARNIVLNADFIMMLKQSPLDRQRWVNLLSLSEQEEECIDESAEAGDGLLIFGKSRIPIRGKFPDGNILYELFSTNPNELAEKKRLHQSNERESSLIG